MNENIYQGRYLVQSLRCALGCQHSQWSAWLEIGSSISNLDSHYCASCEDVDNGSSTCVPANHRGNLDLIQDC